MRNTTEGFLLTHARKFNCLQLVLGASGITLNSIRWPVKPVKGVQEQQGRVLGMVDSLSVSTQAALAGLEARLLRLEANIGACLPGELSRKDIM